ncbi:MAG: hypothetical protein IJ428_03330 [Clostridia bacterium]|nr:hypothetical protein [Clostridia bacterium]
MNGKETMTALHELAKRYADEYVSRLAELSPDAKTERKALLIQKNMAEICAVFPKYEYNGHIYETREKQVFGQNNHYFDAYRRTYDSLDADEREAFLIYAAAITLARCNFYDKRKAELDCGEGTAESVFEARLICGVVGQILDDWCAWWRQNFPHIDIGGV